MSSLEMTLGPLLFILLGQFSWLWTSDFVVSAVSDLPALRSLQSLEREDRFSLEDFRNADSLTAPPHFKFSRNALDSSIKNTSSSTHFSAFPYPFITDISSFDAVETSSHSFLPFAPSPSPLPSASSPLHRDRRGLMDLLSAASGYGGGGYGGYGGYGGGYSGGSSYSGGYGYSSGCDCSGFDSIGLIAGASSLAAAGAFLIAQLVNNTGRSLPDYWEGPGGWIVPLPGALPDMLPVPVSEMMVKAFPPMEASERVSRTCDVIAELEEEALAAEAAEKTLRREEEEMMGRGRSGGGGKCNKSCLLNSSQCLIHCHIH